MSMKVIALAAFFAVGLAQGQTTPQSQVFDFKNNPTQQGLQEIATILRTVGDIQQLSIDSAASTLTVSGNTDQLAMTGWIVHQLDQPVTDPVSATASPLQYLVAGKSDDVIRVFHLNTVSPKAPQGIQEILTTLRTVANVQKVFNYTALSDLVVRGPAAQMALSAYLIGAFDVAKGSVTASASAEFPYQAPGQAPQVARVFYLKNANTPQAVQEILTVMRTVLDVQKIFCYTPLTAIAISSSADNLAASEFVIQSLDIAPSAKPGPTASARELVMPGGSPLGTVVRVFYPPHIATPKALQEALTLLRTKLFIQKVFNYSPLQALVVRSSPDVIAKADQLIQEQDKLAMATP